MAAVGLKTHIWGNNVRSMLLLAGFPVLLTFMVYAAHLAIIGSSEGSGSLDGDFAAANASFGGAMALAIIVSAIWFVIAWLSNQAIIDAVTGARKVERRDQPELYNLLENLAISCGMKTPTLRIIEQPELNAFASGLQEGHFSISVTRGLLDSLNRDELEAVLAHELTHVINRDVRTIVIASVFAGIISLLAQLIFRWFQFGGRGSGKNKNAGLFILIALGAAAVGYILAIVIRLAISRRREFIADAGSVELTKNPDAMISALRKVSGRSGIKAPDEVAGLFLDHQETGFSSLFATHPPMEKRIEALVRFAGGRDAGPMEELEAPGEAAVTAVPPTADRPAATSVPQTY